MKSPKGKTRGAARGSVAELPLYCDYHCPHASFAPADATGACRREQGVFCRLLRAFNLKNSPCRVRLQDPPRRRFQQQP